MKILHVVTLSELGGAQSVVLNLAIESSEIGHQVMVVSSKGGDLWKVLPDTILKWEIEALHREVRPLDDLKVFFELRKIFRQFAPDVIHLHSSKIGLVGRFAFPSKRIIYTVHGFDSIRISFRQFLPFEKLFQSLCARIVSVSKYDQRNLISEGINHNLHCIPNGVQDYTVDKHRWENSRLKFLQETMRSVKGFKVICIARISKQKNFDLFCEIAKSLVNHEINFFWIGNKEPLFNLPPNLHCLGEVENAHVLLDEADLFMLPTNYEGMPISILEALCYSTPVVASSVGGVPEVLDGKNGNALRNNAEEFSQAILRYAYDPEALHKASLAARASFDEAYRVDKMHTAYLSLYDEIVLASQSKVFGRLLKTI